MLSQRKVTTPINGDAADTGSRLTWAPQGLLAGEAVCGLLNATASELPKFALFLLMLISLYLPKLSARLAFENWLERIMPFNKTRSLLCELLHLATGILLMCSKHRPSASHLPGAPPRNLGRDQH